MKKSPIITVYITNYNYKKYLNQSIQSVLSQSYTDYELLIIDDGSTDGSAEILKKYENTININVIYQKNKGLNITNNIATRTATGKYIMRLDADDYLHPDALKLMVQKLESDDDLGLVFPDYYYVDEYGNIISEEKRYNFENEVTLYDLPAHGACTMIRLSFLKEVGGYDESFSCQDGYELWIKFIAKFKVTNITVPLFYYRRHNNNLTNNETKILKTREKIKDSYIKNIQGNLPATIIVIPVRTQFISGHNWPLYSLDGQSILERKVETALRANNATHIAIVSAEDEIIQYCKNKYPNEQRISIITRPREYAAFNVSLLKTFEYVMLELSKKNIHIDAILSLALEYPYTESSTIDDAINTMIIFDTDTVLSVRSNNLAHYRHTGHTLEPILEQENFTKYEREVLYTACGGILLSKANNLIKHRKLISGKIGHIIVDSKIAFGVMNEFDFQIFNSLELSK